MKTPIINEQSLRLGTFYQTEEGIVLQIESAWEIDESGTHKYSTVLSDDILMNLGFGEKRETNIPNVFEYSYLKTKEIGGGYELTVLFYKQEVSVFEKKKLIGIRKLIFAHDFQNLITGVTRHII